ncbi:MAG: lipocalin family protein [Gillisia sp.]|nr:lipocalin family protein [Gillisia sp.]
MKNITYLFVMVFAVMLSVSCSGDGDSDNDNNLSTNLLVGTWGTSGIAEGMELEATVTFNANNSGASVFKYTVEGVTEKEIENFTWSTSGNKLTMESSSGESEVVTYAINGNKLTITDQDGYVVVFTKK